MEEDKDSANEHSHISKNDEINIELDKKMIGLGNEGFSGSEDELDPNLGQDSPQTESSVAIEILGTKGDVDSFFHAVFGENSSGTFEAKWVKDMRDEWYKLLNQFTSLQDPNMPKDLKKQLEDVLDKAINEITLEPAFKHSESTANAPQLNDDITTGNVSHGITEQLAKSASDHFLKSIRQTYESEEFYKVYLDSIKSADHWVTLEEIPILASLANVEIEVYYGGHNQHLTFKPNVENLFGVYERNSSLWTNQKKVIVYYENYNFSRAMLKSTLDPLQSDGLAYPTGIFDEEYCLNGDDPNSKLIVYDGTGNFYEDGFDANQNISGFGRLLSQDGKEYVAGEWHGNEWTDVLLCKIGQQGFTSPFIYTKINNENGLLTPVDKEFLARVRINDAKEFHLVRSYSEMNVDIFQRLKIVEIIEDRKMDEYNEACDRFTYLLRERSKKTADCYQYAEDLLQFSKILENFKWNFYGLSCQDVNSKLLNYMISTEQISTKIKQEVEKLQGAIKALSERNFKFLEVHEVKTRDLLALLWEVYEEGVRYHKNSLLSKCPTSNSLWMQSINDLSEKTSLYISSKDLKLFTDLEAVVAQQRYPTEEVRLSYERIFKEFFGDLRRHFFESAKLIKKHVLLEDHAPMTNPVYLYLYKSFQKVLIELCTSAHILPQSCIARSEGTWIMKSKLVSGCDASRTNKVLEQLCRLIFESMESFQPGRRDNRSLIKKLFDWATTPKRDEIDLPADRLIWLNIVEKSMTSIKETLPKGLKEDFKKLSGPLMVGYKIIVQQESDNFETLQKIAGGIVQESLKMAEDLQMEGCSVSITRGTYSTLLSTLASRETRMEDLGDNATKIITGSSNIEEDKKGHNLEMEKSHSAITLEPEGIHFGNDYSLSKYPTKVLNSKLTKTAKVATSIPSSRTDHRGSRKIRYDGIGNFVVEGLDVSSEISGFGRSMSVDGKQYIAGEWKDNEWTDVLLCKFTSQGITSPLIYTRVDSEDGLLTSVDNNFLARVRFDNLRGLCMTWPYPIIMEEILQRLKIVKVIEDRMVDKYNNTVERFKDFLSGWSDKTVNCFDRAQDFLQIFNILENSRLSVNSSRCLDLNIRLLDGIVQNEHVSIKLKDETKKILSAKQSLDRRNSAFPGIQKANIKDVFEVLSNICMEGLECHKKNLLGKCPTDSWTLNFNSLTNEQALFINSRDLHLLLDLETAVTQQIYSKENMKSTYTCLFQQFVEDLRQDFFGKVEGIKKHNSLKDYAPLTNPVYLYLYRSFQELLIEVCSSASISPQSFFTKSNGKWMLSSGVITWPVASPANQVSVQQCRFIFEWMEHFQPGNYSQEDSKTRLLGAIDRTQSTWKTFSQYENVDLPYNRLIWLIIVDDAIASIMRDLHMTLKDSFKRLSDPLIMGYIDFLQQESDNFESFRTTAHCIVKLAAQMSSRVSEMSLLSGIDESLLEKQVLFISNTISTEGKERLGEYFAILINILTDYWELNESFVPEVRKKFFDTTFKFNMQSIREEWSRIMNTVFTIGGGKLDEIIDFMRAFAEFVDELKHLKFEWFVKKDSTSRELLSAGILEVVDNKLSDDNEASYLVKEPETFVRVLREEEEVIPPHYVIKIVQKMLATVNTALQRKELGDNTSPNHSRCSNVAPALLSAMRSSFLYLKEQPDYRDFELFFRESTDPFVNVLNETQEEITERIARIKESFWYIRKQDEIGIERALDLFENMNNESFSRDTLKSSYDEYLNQFNSFLDIYSKQNSTKTIIASVRESAQMANDFRIEEWTPEFKMGTIPKLLAGLAAIWCIRESKDIASTGKSLKPHCVQILCILRLLSVDMNFKGVEKHLAQVSTGQGKSLVLGLLSSLLALVGYNVRVVCYSEYLSSRDMQDFEGYFEEFIIRDKITYDTFEGMAFDCPSVEVEGEKQDISQLVENRIRGTEHMEPNCEIKDANVKNTILLIDEVDVFFSDEFYGNICGICSIIGMPMLADIQTEIWKIIQGGCHEKETVIEKMQIYTSGLDEQSQNFLSNPKTYNLFLRNKRSYQFENVKYSNRSLFNEQLEIMIEHALNVFSGRGRNNKYILNEESIIALRKDDGLYSTRWYAGYYNVFNYFRLKGNDYDHKNHRNYGYFIIDCGAIAYAKLPEEYPLILGVSGTLKGLNKHERATITNIYEINRNSVMPSYFGNSNLKFDNDHDLVILETEETWLNMIFSHADSQIRLKRSVLIFFDTDDEIDKFKNIYHSKIARLYVLTINTKPLERERYVTEAGVAETVTLATRTMGRGVDFKSSLAVERKGGIHVIQSFFSLDEKEETQIKGRTARKDNQGSYELILCREQLLKEGYSDWDCCNGNSTYLSRRRQQLVDIKGRNAANRIKKSENEHNVTMQFLKSFCH